MRNPQKLSRRKALKTLLAAGGAVTLSTVPRRWEKPSIQMGILPAFAQVSALTLSNLRRILEGSVNNCSGGNGSSFRVSCDYNDPTGRVTTTGTRLVYTFAFRPSGLSGTTYDSDLTGVTTTGDGFSGTITMNVCTQFSGDTGITDTFQLTNSNGQTATISTTTPAPPGANQTPGQSGSQTIM